MKEFGVEACPPNNVGHMDMVVYLVETGGIRTLIWGDNRHNPPDAFWQSVGQVDVLTLPVDGSQHILSFDQGNAIVERLKPKVVIPTHYLGETTTYTLSTLQPADEWVKSQKSFKMLDGPSLSLAAADVGKMDRASGVRYFAVACGSGFDAELMAHTSGEAKRRWGFAAYVARAWHLVKDTTPVPYKVTVDGRVLDLQASSVLVANCSEFMPPLLRLGPGIALDDGVLDAVIFSAGGVAGAAQVMLKLLARRVDGSMIRHVRGQEVKVESTPPRPVQLDGEVDGETPFTATVVHNALSVLVPAESR